MQGIKRAIILSIMTSINLCFPSILLRNTYERYEGLDWPLPGWSSQTGNDGEILLDVETPENAYQTHAHGERCLHFIDPNNSSYTSAYKSFSNSSSEYMVEFYLWIYHSHATIDSFPLCVLKNVPSEGLPVQTDIALVLDTVAALPNGHPYKIIVQDSIGFHFGAYIDSVDRWFKIQIYRHPVPIGGPKVDLYLDGDSVGTYYPIHSDKVSNTIVLGTTQADSLAEGEVFYDDIIIATPPVGEHPRLLFTDIDWLKGRANSTNITPIGRSLNSIWNGIRSLAHNYATTDTIIVVTVPRFNNPNIIDTFYFYHPFPYPVLSCTSSNRFVWPRLCGQIQMRLIRMAFAYAITDSTLYKEKALEILSSISNWSQWLNPFAKQGLVIQYANFETFNLVYGFAIAYDLLFNALSSYDKISFQNTLLALGIGQEYLESLYGIHGSNLEQCQEGSWQYPDGGNWPNMYIFHNSALGFGSNLIRSEFLNEPNELIRARAKIDTLFQHDSICDPAGGYVEGVEYSTSFERLIPFGVADSIGGNYNLINNPYLLNAPYFRVYSKAPGNILNYSQGRRELNFNDAYEFSGNANAHLLKYATRNNDPLIQYYFRYTYTSYDFEYLLWADTNLPAEHPPGNMFGRLFPNIGWAILRNGWDNSHYQIAMKSGRRVGHTQRDNNTIIIGTNNRWLIIDAGYAQLDQPRLWPVNHNVVIVNNDTLNPYDTTGTISRFYISADSIFGYLRGDASNAYNELQKYTRDIVFVNKNDACFFVINDGVKRTVQIDSLSWLFHTWGDASWIADRQIVRITDTQQGNNEYLDIKVLWPDSILYNTVIIQDNTGGDSTRTRIYLKKKYPDSVEQFIAVLIPDHNNQPTITAEKIVGSGLIGTKVNNTAVLFGEKADSVPGGKYGVLVTDLLLNIVCNLVPDTSYLVIKKRGSEPEIEDTLESNEVGILSFKLYGTGNWKVIITLAQTTGSIKINQDQSYCNLPYVALKLQALNPFTGEPADSMKLTQEERLGPPHFFLSLEGKG